LKIKNRNQRNGSGHLLDLEERAQRKQKEKAGDKIQRLNLLLESRVIERTAQLEAAKKELNALSYSLSHDLRAPLRHILGYLDILRTAAGKTLDEANRQHLETIAQSAARMEQMIEGMLEFSRLSQVEMHLQPVSLNALVKAVRREMGSEIKGRRIAWQIGDLPEVQGDSLMLRQAIVNLLSNAIKYTRLRPNAKIEVGAKHTRRETIFFVRDNGVGFDMNCAHKLFGVFQRFHPSSEFEGTGIGLAIVRVIIHRHGGRTWAESKIARGATFYCAIPEPPRGET
jgi:light-regulated signal transduction histidine kinase (bacteriophytochrome)